MKTNKTYMVTGGAGYIGSHMVKLLCDEGHDVIIVDNLSTGKYELVDNRATFHNCNIINSIEMNKIFANNNIDGVYHFASYSQVGESMTNPLKYYHNNVYGIIELLSLMTKWNVKNLVFSSTAAVYGNVLCKNIVETEVTPSPINPYGMSKLVMENIIKDVCKSSNINYCIFRYFNVAGADELGKIGELHNPETHLVPLVIDTVLGNRDYISIYGNDYDTYDGTCIRDYIHVCDLVDAHYLGMNYIEDNKVSNIFNLGNGQGYSVNDIIDSVEKVTKTKVNTKIEDRRAGDPSILVADANRAKQQLGWEPKRKLDKIILDAYNFHKGDK